MQLTLPVPDGWEVRSFENGRRVVIVPPLPAGGVPDLVVDLDPLVPAPDDPRAWIAAAMARDIPAGASVVTLAAQPGKTSVGWPMELVHAQVVDAAGATLEIRLGGFYKLNEWGGHALVRSTSAPRFEAARAQLTELLVEARPSWRSREIVTCLADLWA
jgi:hypothetical protein